MAAKQRHNAGALDIRAIIAYLIGIYGLVLVAYGLFDFDADEKVKADGYNIDLWGGLGMIVLAVCFLLWNWINPTKVPDDQVPDDSPSPSSDATPSR